MWACDAHFVQRKMRENTQNLAKNVSRLQNRQLGLTQPDPHANTGQRFTHVGIAHPLAANLRYFRGKWKKALAYFWATDLQAKSEHPRFAHLGTGAFPSKPVYIFSKICFVHDLPGLNCSPRSETIATNERGTEVSSPDGLTGCVYIWLTVLLFLLLHLQQRQTEILSEP